MIIVLVISSHDCHDPRELDLFIILIEPVLVFMHGWYEVFEDTCVDCISDVIHFSVLSWSLGVSGSLLSKSAAIFFAT